MRYVKPGYLIVSNLSTFITFCIRIICYVDDALETEALLAKLSKGLLSDNGDVIVMMGFLPPSNLSHGVYHPTNGIP